MTTGTVRADAADLEFGVGIYRDRGCEVAPKCLECPLPQCRYDVPGGARVMINRERDDEIKRLRADHMSVDDIVARFQISRRSVFRALASRP